MKALLSGFATLALCAAASAQTSPLYVTSWNSPGTTWVFQGGSQINSYTWVGQNEHAMAIASEVRSIGAFPGNNGAEYSLSGSFQGPTYSNPSYNSFYDGTTDGSNYNYSTDHNGSNQLYRFDRNWGSGTALFTVPIGSDGSIRSSGVAYDSTDGTIWISRTVGGAADLIHMNLSGGTIGSFPVGAGAGCYGVGLDPADDTLWCTEYQGGRLYQYNKSGTLLQTVSTGLSSTFGAEFAAGIPAPGSLALIGLGGLAAARRRNR